MIKCPVCGKEMPERNTKCYACHSEFTYGKKGRFRSIIRGDDILQEKKRKLEEMQYESLPKKHCPTCGNVVRQGEYYCHICGEEDAYIEGPSLPNM
jgi:hypothetical protein